jgi:hypothetical protein
VEFVTLVEKIKEDIQRIYEKLGTTPTIDNFKNNTTNVSWVTACKKLQKMIVEMILLKYAVYQ